MKTGYKVVTSNAIVYHYGSLSWDSFPLRKAYLSAQNRLYFVMKHYPKRTLLRYVFEFPVKSFKVDLCRFLKQETVLQRMEKSKRENSQKKIPVKAIKEATIENTLFFVALLAAALGKKRLGNVHSLIPVENPKNLKKQK